MSRFVGIDIGAETVKVVELTGEAGQLAWTRREVREHGKEPGKTLVEILSRWDWDGVEAATVSGRLGRQVNLPRVPQKQAQAGGYRQRFGAGAATVVSIGSHGFSVLELREGGAEVFRENSRCSQGTGNFLRQLVERFDLGIEEAAAIAAAEPTPAALSGRCPVILKTDMTHLANKGESKGRILAGLFDAVCENVQVLLKPSVSPARVVLVGGVSRSTRVRRRFGEFCERHGMELVPMPEDDALFLEALGAARAASERPAWRPELDELFRPPEHTHLEEVPALAAALARVKRLPKEPLADASGPLRDLILGFDIGSTGSKAVAIDAATKEVVWEGYLRTNGDPVGAAQTLMREFAAGPAGRHPLRAMGATGSGREIAGSLMATCYGAERVFVLNEIAAHAAGALHHDPAVDTIFEIGGQDAKYIRLADGRVVDAAMNEACSAGTGSFIEEQGKRFSGIENVAQLGAEALAAEGGVALGQHCSVFMAEIIDEAVASGVEQTRIVAGIYDSIIQNYLNRVKGSRSVGGRIFCQGMPFAADALAAAAARQTGSDVVIPPNPGTVGALGIALLTLRELGEGEELAARPAADPARFLSARVDRKDTFVCQAVTGCGGAGNKCRIDRLMTVVEEKRSRFTWGGGCALWDKGTRKKKLPDRAPDPFREREELVGRLAAEVGRDRGRRKVAITDEFQLKGLFPFFATFIDRLGFDVRVHTGADRVNLKRGIEEANVPFCAPMQQYHGVVSSLADERVDFLFLPMLRDIPRVKDERASVVCPIVQSSADMLRWDLGGRIQAKILSPIIDAGEGLGSDVFRGACREIARELGALGRFELAFAAARSGQDRFDRECLELGRTALRFCQENGITPVVVLGRTYTIHNTVLNSNVPAILREQGAVPIPIDCYPVDDAVPVFDDMFWGHGQRILRAAHQVRRTPGLYSVFCSNYSCGPDSFTTHFFAYLMEGKPFVLIETDGHSGDAGTKTRIEAFLHCVKEDLARATPRRRANSLELIELDKEGIADIRRRKEIALIQPMGPGALAIAAALRGAGLRAEALPVPDRETLRLGRRYTSGKECVPMTLTLGSVLRRVEAAGEDERFAMLMPGSSGPCRFGAYGTLHKIVHERLGLKDRIRTWAPPFENYFEGLSAGFSSLVWTGLLVADLLLDALYHARPVETKRGAAQALYQRYLDEMVALLERAGGEELTVARVLLEVGSNRLFGATELLRRAGRDFAAIQSDRDLPTVMVVGEIYVRSEPFSNDFIVDQLEERGIRVRFAPITEWIEYSDHIGHKRGDRPGIGDRITSLIQARIQQACHAAIGKPLGSAPRTTVTDSLAASAPYLRDALEVESVLTLGGPLHELREGLIDAVLSVGPLECMPNKIAESQFFHVAEKEGLLSLTLALNGDPIDPEIVDNFAYEVHSRFRRRRAGDEALTRAAAEATRRLVEQLQRAVRGQSAPATCAAGNGASVPGDAREEPLVQIGRLVQ